MKTVLAIALCLICTIASAQAQNPPQSPQLQAGGQRFEQAKSKRLAKISARMDALQKQQACVQASADFSTMHACRPARR